MVHTLDLNISKYNSSKSINYTVNENGCWVCTSHHKTSHGYPVCRRDGKLQTISRYIYKHLKGSIPKGMCIRHTCDNPECINPEHLIVGTPRDNANDRVKRKRGAYGERSGTAKLTEKDVLNIKKLLKSKTKTQKEIGIVFGVGQDVISRIKSGDAWKYLR